MHLQNNTGCHIILIGFLKETSELQMDQSGNLTIRLIIQTHIRNHYHVIVSGDAALRIRQSGFSNVRLWIEGNLQPKENKNFIFADKVAFVIDSEPNAEITQKSYAMDLQFVKSIIHSNEVRTLH